MAGKAERERSAHWPRKAQLKTATEGVGLHETVLTSEAVKVQRAEGAAAVLNHGQFAIFDDVR